MRNIDSTLKALETYQCPNWPTNQSDCPTNDHPTVAALHVLTERALELPSATKEQGGYVFRSYISTYKISKLQGIPCARGMGCVDLNFECSTVCPNLPGLLGIWQKRLCSWARWWNTQIKVNPTQFYQHMGRPVEMFYNYNY